MRKRANTINLFTTLLVVVWVFACVTLKAANKNFVVVSYDVSLSMAGYSGKDQINRWITVEAHDRIKSYLNVLLNNGWNNQQLLSSDDSIVVNLQPDSILNKTALIGNDSGWAILHFAENVKVVATGGLGNLIASETQCIDIYNPNLTLYGMKFIYDKQKR